MTPVDRQRGCLYGLAIGDALGAAIEFQGPGTFEPVTGFRAGGPHGVGGLVVCCEPSMIPFLRDARRTWIVANVTGLR